MNSKVRKILIFTLVIVIIFSFIMICVEGLKWNTERTKLRSVQGVVTDLKIKEYFGEDTYFFKVVSFNLEHEWILAFDESDVMEPVIGRFDEYFQNVEVGDYILVWYHKSIMWDNFVTKYVIIVKNISWWASDYFGEFGN